MSTNPKGYMKKYFAKNGHSNYYKYIGTAERILDINSREKARKKLGVKSKKMEVDHKDGNPRNNARSNLRVISRRKNRQLGGASKKRTDGRLG